MANYKATDTEFQSVANAIRTKGGTQAQLSWPSGFVDAIGAIPTGGGGSTIIAKPDTITQNGTYYASTDNADGYSQVTVNVSSGSIMPAPMIVTASSTHSSSPKQPSGIFGDIAGNFWGSNGRSQWLNIKFTTPFILNKVELSNYYRVNSSTYWYSSAITVRASNDGFSTYTDLYTGAGVAQSETQFEIDLNNSTPYTEYRFIVGDNTAYVGLGRVELFGAI